MIIDWILKYWIQFLFGLIIAGMSYLYSRYKAWKKRSDNLEDGMRALLRNSIISNYHKYTDLGSCPIYAKENVEAMYNAYHNLGGNGVGTRMYENIMALPTREDDKPC